mmetsp:Transcript_1429/g.3269  ORF Transcript_1429/g.3269 Transcript_1429/m.3269 type:complete len:334 (-) Transcript_1429:249-1250(-)
MCSCLAMSSSVSGLDSSATSIASDDGRTAASSSVPGLFNPSDADGGGGTFTCEGIDTGDGKAARAPCATTADRATACWWCWWCFALLAAASAVLRRVLSRSSSSALCFALAASAASSIAAFAAALAACALATAAWRAAMARAPLARAAALASAAAVSAGSPPAMAARARASRMRSDSGNIANPLAPPPSRRAFFEPPAGAKTVGARVVVPPSRATVGGRVKVPTSIVVVIPAAIVAFLFSCSRGLLTPVMTAWDGEAEICRCCSLNWALSRLRGGRWCSILEKWVSVAIVAIVAVATVVLRMSDGTPSAAPTIHCTCVGSPPLRANQSPARQP